MKKELEEKLRYMQDHPTTGTPHNEQQIFTQVETVFALDSLQQEVSRLTSTIEKSNKQSKKLEQSNYRLQIAMFVLTAISTGIAVFAFLREFISLDSEWLKQILNSLGAIPSLELLVTVIPALLSVIAGVTTFFIEKKAIKNFQIDIQEKNKVTDNFEALLQDKDGNIRNHVKQSG